MNELANSFSEILEDSGAEYRGYEIVPTTLTDTIGGEMIDAYMVKGDLPGEFLSIGGVGVFHTTAACRFIIDEYLEG